MTQLWYQNPLILLNNLGHFLPNKDLSREEKINAIARLAIYLAIIIIIFRLDSKWLSISAIILIITFLLGYVEKFTTLNRTIDPTVCTHPTESNPFSNYTIDDLIESRDKPPACPYDKVKKEMREKFRSNIYSDSSDIWGKFISDRNYYTMPNTEIVNRQTEFAEWCFGNSGECKTTGKNCLKVRDPVYHRGRITTLD
jgi:hypothetical protein